MRLFYVVSLILATFFATVAMSETRLMMVEEDGCPWCERWHREVGDVYPKTAEGLSAPLILHDIHEAIPTGIIINSAPHYTPTFILLVDGTEVDRIEGYPGEGFFWGLLGMMLANLTDSSGVPAES